MIEVGKRCTSVWARCCWVSSGCSLRCKERASTQASISSLSREREREKDGEVMLKSTHCDTAEK